MAFRVSPFEIIYLFIPVFTLIAHIFAGIAVGHVYYFLEDVFPEQPGGFRILKTPGIM